MQACVAFSLLGWCYMVRITRHRVLRPPLRQLTHGRYLMAASENNTISQADAALSLAVVLIAPLSSRTLLLEALAQPTAPT